MEEFGFVRDHEAFSVDSATTARDNYYSFILQLLTDSIKSKAPLAGMNFWGWGCEGRAQQKNHMWKTGDTSYTVDPYSEAQGLNSVFNSDSITLGIISKYAHEINNRQLSAGGNGFSIVHKNDK
jgi:mannan endo-1,4-beta-mannosidase